MKQMCGRGKIAGIASLFIENLPWDRKRKQRWLSWVWSQEEKSGVLKDLELRNTPVLIIKNIRSFWTDVYLNVLELEFE